MFLVLLFISCYFRIILGQNNVVVQTTNGSVLGRITSTIDQNKTYYAYQGIPFAKPPVGNLRFRAPLPADKWTGVYNATYDRAKCVQFFEGSEDCLYLNVYSPVHDIPKKLLPVMVWFFGGYFIYGEGSFKYFGPDYFIDENVLVVSFNYRVGIFGFLSTGDKASPGNYGLKDQIMVLKWVKENIKNFGGDPESITIFGESAGSASICYLIQSPLANGLFHRAIMESGTSLNLFAYARNPQKAAFDTGDLLAIFTDDTQELVDELRDTDVNILQLVSTITNIGLSILNNIKNGISFAPTIEPESPEAVVTGKSHQLLKNGNFNRVPIIIGFNSQESIPIMEMLDYIKLYVAMYDLSPIKLVPIDMNIQDDDILDEVADKIKDYYFGDTPIIFSDVNLTQFITDDQFVRPIVEAARLFSNYTEVYLYRYSFDGWLGLDDSATENYPGVGHEEEVYYLFKDSTRHRIPTATDTLTRKRLVRLWTNFAKNGNPTPNDDPLLQKSRWIQTSPTNLTYFDIGENITTKTSLRNYSISWWNDLYARYGVPPYNTY